jgi:rhombotail lipoprotein
MKNVRHRKYDTGRMKEMKRKSIFIGIAISLLLLSGCALQKGLNRGAIKESMYSAQIVTDDEIKRVLELKPQVKFPFKLGIYFSDSLNGWCDGCHTKWKKDEQDITWLDPLKAEGIISEIIPISSITVAKDGDKYSFLKSIRLAAARHNVDAVLVVDYNSGVDRYNNFSSFLYITIIGGYLIPGTHSDALVIMNGALWDVRNEYLYLTVEAEGTANKIGPAFLLEDKDSVQSAKESALKQFKDEVIKRMKNLKGVK